MAMGNQKQQSKMGRGDLPSTRPIAIGFSPVPTFLSFSGTESTKTKFDERPQL